MQSLTQKNKHAADLYWLAFLLTGQRQSSIDLAVETIESEGRETGFFSKWMRTWSRKIVIAKALAAIREELTASAGRMELRGCDDSALPGNQPFDNSISKIHLERALLALDVFPRCAVLLSIFERAPLADVAVLLNADRDLVRKAQMAGLRELTRNLAAMQGWTSRATSSYVLTSGMQHA